MPGRLLVRICPQCASVRGVPARVRCWLAPAAKALNQATPLFVPPATRHEIPFDGSHLVGLLRLPVEGGPHPTVLLIPGLDSTKEEFRDVERAFLDRGMATFALDEPGQGEAEWSLAIRPDWEVVGAAVISYLQSLRDVDPTRVGVWGVSLGGFYAARLASADLPIRGTIALAGPYNLGATWKDLNPLTRHAFEVRSHSASPDDAEKRIVRPARVTVTPDSSSRLRSRPNSTLE